MSNCCAFVSHIIIAVASPHYTTHSQTPEAPGCCFTSPALIVICLSEVFCPFHNQHLGFISPSFHDRLSQHICFRVSCSSSTSLPWVYLPSGRYHSSFSGVFLFSFLSLFFFILKRHRLSFFVTIF